MEKAIIVARCSTNENKQDVSRQTEELNAKFNSLYKIEKSFSYYQSGTNNQDMNSEILAYVISNKIENIIVSEISRISRKVIDVLQFIEKCNNEKINVIIENYNLHSLNSDKTINTMVQMMLSIGASFAQMELEQTKSRLNSGRLKFINDGGKLGRKIGYRKSNEELLEENKDIVKFIKQDQSIRNIMKLTGKSSGTVQKVKKVITQKGNHF